MRLIDKDALLKRMQEDPLFDLVERYGVSGVINAEPTVDAVPVEWIEVDIEASAFSGYDIHAYEVTTMLEEWKEKERKEEK